MDQPQDLRLSFSPSPWERVRLAAVMQFQRTLFVVFVLAWPMVGITLAVIALTSDLPVGATVWRLVAFCFALMPVVLAISAIGALVVGGRMREPLNYAFDGGGVHVWTSAFQHTHAWSQIVRMKRSGGFLLLFVSPRQAHAIPLRVLTGPQETALTALARAHGVGAAAG